MSEENETEDPAPERFPNEKAFMEAHERNKFKPGVSGNPAGKPKGRKNRSTILRELLILKMKDLKTGQPLANPFDPDEKEMTIEKAINARLVQKAVNGDLNAIKEIFDTMYGKNPDIVIPLDEMPDSASKENKELKGEALAEELRKRGLPTAILEE